jgi:hypothetical protein
MSKERRSKAVIIQSALLSVILFLNGCIGMTYVKKTESEGLVSIGSLGKYFPLSSSDYPEPAASKIGEHIKLIATPEEWVAIQCLGGVTLDSVSLMNSLGYCQDCSGAFALTQTFQSALAHALDGTSSPPHNCTGIKSPKLQVTFLYKPPQEEPSLWLLPLAIITYGLACVGSLYLLCPGPMDVMVRINAVAQPLQGVEVQAVGFGAATRVTTSFAYDSEKTAVFLALAEAIKALATDLKKQVDEQCKANEALPLTDSLRFRCGEAP